jgi:bacterioferritin B
VSVILPTELERQGLISAEVEAEEAISFLLSSFVLFYPPELMRAVSRVQRRGGLARRPPPSAGVNDDTDGLTDATGVAAASDPPQRPGRRGREAEDWYERVDANELDEETTSSSFRASARAAFVLNTRRGGGTPMGKFTEALNEQVASEFAASQQYVAIAVSYDAETLPQLARHFYRQAVEERNHAMMIVQYLLDADVQVTIPGIAAPQSSFEDERAPVELALRQEKTVTEQIVRLVQLAREENEHVGEQFLGWFLAEQREEVASMADLLSVIDRASTQNMLLVEDYLARVPVSAAEPPGYAPPAAGGTL